MILKIIALFVLFIYLFYILWGGFAIAKEKNRTSAFIALSVFIICLQVCKPIQILEEWAKLLPDSKVIKEDKK